MLDTASLDAITQEARACFLYEDAPEYLVAFERDLQQLALGADTVPEAHTYNGLMRTAHSLKGGAGIAQLPHLQLLAHQIEDLLEALHGGRVEQTQQAHSLLTAGVESANHLIAASIRGGEGGEAAAATDLEIFKLLEQFLETLPEAVEEDRGAAAIAPNDFLIQTALTVDLEECIERVEVALKRGKLSEVVPGFVEECTLLGEALNLAWLAQSVLPLQAAPIEDADTIQTEVREAIATIRERRERLLSPSPAAPNKTESREIASDPVPATPESNPVSDLAIPPSVQQESSGTESTASEIATPGINLRIPVTRLNRINNVLGELLIARERLMLHHRQLQQANRTLHQRAQQLAPLNERISSVYDRLSTNVPTHNSRDRALNQQAATPTDSAASSPEFDALELDRYTELHSTLQDFQELMVRVQETRSDIDVIQLDFGESLESLRQDLDGLRSELTQSRLAPFHTLTDRFFAPLQSLNREYNKSVSLAIEGADIPIDLAILEQLQTPLTQLFRNAFAHGIEDPAERLAAGKSADATITLSAQVQSNRVSLSISDDGRGIDRQAVLDKAIQQRLCSPDAASRLTPQQIYGFLFTPGFSTATATTSLAGRGVGLDIVQLQVDRLRGLVRVSSTPGRGTVFTLSIPLSLNILPLLICRCQQQLLAMPSVKVLEAISLQEYRELGRVEGDRLLWQERSLPLKSLLDLLPYAEQPSSGDCPLALVADMGGTEIALRIDALEGERELVLKPFDTTVPVPGYLAGCTVLGDGRVVPVLDPDLLEELWTASSQLTSTPSIASQTPAPSQADSTDVASTILVADDSIAVRRALTRLLTQAGYQVLECRDGKEALDTFTSSHQAFDLVITDIEMPRLDGFGVLQAIRDRTSSLPVAMLTSRENDRHRQKAFSLGATAYFSKPFQPRDMLLEVEKLLQKQVS
ncbi:response regulator [Synechococcus sp. PCC 7336]|uniref:hybrid sensor histidine kinase/response regulator n=1 Tax=Synechococcus sp. PCC 7336 TaxID=195250 RepID=UPI00034D5960|nr:response regulator [Synechococcus sp. PCC 7336]